MLKLQDFEIKLALVVKNTKTEIKIRDADDTIIFIVLNHETEVIEEPHSSKYLIKDIMVGIFIYI